MQLIKGGLIPRTVILICVGLLIVGSTNLAAAPWAGYTETTGGVLSVKNPGLPMLPAETVETEEMWRVGGEDDEDNDIMGFVTDVLVDDQGNSYLLDSTLKVIRVFGPDGTFLRNISGEGEGPGEFSMANSFMLMPNKKIGIVQMMPAKIVTVDLEGIPGEHFSLGGDGGMKMVRNAGASDHSVVIGMVSPNFQDGSIVTTHSLAIVDPSGEVQHTIIENKKKEKGGSLSLGGGDNSFTEQWSVGHDGKVYVAQHNYEYKIEVFDDEGKATKSISRDYDSLKRTPEAIAEDEERNADMAARFGGNIEIDIPQFERDIRSLHPRQDGVLWVATSRGNQECPEGKLGVFDEYDADGKFVRQISIKADYNPTHDRYVLLKDRLYVLKEAQMQPASTSSSGGGGSMMVMVSGGPSSSDDDGDEDDGAPPGVICYRLKR
jgi:hypothetical protein